MEEKLLTILDWCITNGWLVAGTILAFVMALVRTAKDKEADLLEATFCALITLGLSTILIWLKLPLALSMFIGAFIGGLGSKWAQQKMIDHAEDRLSGKYADLKKELDELRNQK